MLSVNDEAIPLEDEFDSDLVFDEPLTNIRPESFIETDREILVFDGEASGNIYNLLACSNGNYITNPDGLGTNECFQFLCIQGNENTLHFGFAFGYDINKMMKDLAKHQLQRLGRHGTVRWRDWVITHIPGKRFGIRNLNTGDYCTIWDVFPFVQCSFVKWIAEWKLVDEETIARIKYMKDRRDEFENEIFENILAYCLEECTIAVTGIRKLIGTCEKVGIHLTSYYGAGSLASAMMKKHNIFYYIGNTPRYIEELADRAYFGGRSETSIIGRATGPIICYDIRSAYPAACAELLPCLAHGDWIEENDLSNYESNPVPEISLCEVEWDLRERNQVWFGPFPAHPVRGSIRYPLSGRGIYWGIEVNAARRMYPYSIRVLSVHSFQRKCSHQPFAFVRYTYDERAALKAKGDFGHMPLKLGLNSLYGKTAQKIGNAPYRCLVWAGLITAYTRAKILSAVMQDPEAILSIATDAVVSKRELDLPVSEKLGGWERKVIKWIFIAQCGVYFYSDGSENVKKSRGFLPSELSVEVIEKELKEHGVLGKVEISARRFIGYKSALKRKNWGEWNTWAEVTKMLRLRSEPRRRTIGGLERLPQLALAIGGITVDRNFIRTIPPLDCSMWKADEKDEDDSFVLDWQLELDSLLEQPTLFDGDPL